MIVRALQPVRLARWAGPALFAIGLAGLTALWLEPPDQRSLFGWWMLTNAGAYERLLPLVGLGILLGLISLRVCIAAFLAFALGVALGYTYAEAFLEIAGMLPGAARHHFLTGPILSVAVGLPLAAPSRARIVILPFAVAIAGIPLAAAIWATNPRFHDPLTASAGIAFAFWIVAAICLTVRAFRQTWFDIAGRIFGSWLIAIGLLYGGASLIPQRTPTPPPRPLQAPAGSPDSLTGPGPSMTIPDLRPSPLDRQPEGLDPSRQP
jgi:hypothetical protein